MEKKLSCKFVRRLLFILPAILIPLVAVLIFKKKPDEYHPPAPAVTLIQAQSKTIAQGITLSGYIEALAPVPVVPLVSGIITDYPVKTGMKVAEGDILAQIDKKHFIQQMLQAKAVYESFDNAYKRIDSLYASNAATQQDFETVKAQRDSSKAAYELALLQLEHTDIKAPISGTILNAPLSKGSLGNPQQPIALIADLNNLVVRLDIPEKYFNLFTGTQKNLIVYISKSKTAYNGKIRPNAQTDTVSPYIQANTKTFRTVFTLNEDMHDFMPGMFVYVHIIYDIKENVAALPLEVLKTDGSFYTYSPENNTVSKHSLPITIKNDEYFMIPEELKHGWFVLSGQYNIFDGQTVTIITDTGDTPEL
ncbi:efflux RND transporter periplasmic adaptor subunit [Treponema sp. OMZ 840]|uniref:efflux RND transporter periplasmic adaptor subunit n=1 Tax=Treponema sp. OMZ 840 TaxID=244313 RepID=UPI003D91CAF9